MTPGYKSDKPGKSPFMNMDLVPVYDDGTSSPGGSSSVSGYTSISISPERQQAIGIVGRPRPANWPRRSALSAA